LSEGSFLRRQSRRKLSRKDRQGTQRKYRKNNRRKIKKEKKEKKRKESRRDSDTDSEDRNKEKIIKPQRSRRKRLLRRYAPRNDRKAISMQEKPGGFIAG
jgi:hypothetical protein